MIVGRDAELALLGRVGRAGGAVLLRGEPGAGKTALLDEAAASTAVSVLRAVGVESVADIPYAAVAELLRPMRAELRDRSDAGPLRMALGMQTAAADLSALQIEVALEELLSAHAPLLVIVDDVQWLDDASARVVGRLARAAGELGIAVFLAARPDGGDVRGVQEVAVAGLAVDASVTLLRSVDPGLAPGVCAQLVEATAGNPLGLIELPRALSAAQRRGVDPIVAGSGVTSRLAAAFGDRIRRLPSEARLAVIAAAASDPVDADVLPLALELLGVAACAMDAAERDGLLRVAEEIQFRHPLVRMAALGDCTAAERRAVESALGEVVTDLQRRTWHRARATAGTDDDLAAELVRVAASAGARVAYSAQARLLVEAARLSAVPGLRGQYLVDAAHAAWGAGSPRQAEDLLAAAEVSNPASVATTAGLFVRWRLLQWRGETQALVEVIERAVAESHDATPELAVLVRRCAMAQRLQVAEPDPAVVHAEEALARAGNDPWLRFLGHEAAAMACVHAGRVEVALAHCESALALVDAGYGHPDHVRTLGLTLIFCESYPRARRLLAAHVQRQRRADNPYFLASGLCDQGEMLRRTGDLAAAQVAAQEGYDIAARMHHRYLQPLCATVLAHIGLLRGDHGAITLAAQAAAASGEAGNRTLTAPALARARLLAGDPEGALDALAPVIEFEPTGYREPNHSRALTLRLQALIATDQREEAAAIIRRVEAAAGVSTRWTRSTIARYRGVLADHVDDAESAFADALAALAPEDGPLEHGLILLDNGRVVRRTGRRREARSLLQRAHADFTGCGAAALANIAAREIAATGSRLRPRTQPTHMALTAREIEVATLAAKGASDRAIAAELFISVRTVDFHLRNAFRKRGVRSRGELAAQILGQTRESSGG